MYHRVDMLDPVDRIGLGQIGWRVAFHLVGIEYRIGT